MVNRIGNYDNQHTTRWGEKRFAKLFVQAVKETGLGLAAAFSVR